MPLAFSGNRAIFLDRDGVLNAAVIRDGKPYAPASPDELTILHETQEPLQSLHGDGYLLIVVTNQPDVARGTQTRETVEEIHRRLKEVLPIDAIYCCYHDSIDNCSCRKPKPGMLLQAAVDYQLDLTRSYMVGDRWRDIDAGALAGCRTVFIDYGYDERPSSSSPSMTAGSVLEGLEWILRQELDR